MTGLLAKILRPASTATGSDPEGHSGAARSRRASKPRLAGLQRDFRVDTAAASSIESPRRTPSQLPRHERRPALNTTSWPRRSLIALGLGIGLVLAVLPLSAASAAVPTGYWGTETGPVLNYGGMVCKPVAAGGSTYNSRIDITGPMVAETTFYQPTGTSTLGGVQQTRWYPVLEKWQPSTQTWKAVWAPGFYAGTSYGYHYQWFPALWIDVNTLYTDGRFVGGAGYYRLEGTLAWINDASHNGGAMNYQLTKGDYSTSTWNGGLGSGSTPLTTPYCWAG
jgi:hypothetical protein